MSKVQCFLHALRVLVLNLPWSCRKVFYTSGNERMLRWRLGGLAASGAERVTDYAALTAKNVENMADERTRWYNFII